MSELIETPTIKISDAAQEYLRQLLSKQESVGMSVRIFVERAGTPQAECCMAYSPAGEQEENDVCVPCEGFNTYLEEKSVPYLKDAVVDYNPDRFGGQLTFRAPNSKMPQINENAGIEERIEYILQTEINPMLASHGGNVSLEEYEEDTHIAVLRFGGGCQGCSSVDLTLKSGVETTLRERIPELQQVVDVTDHTNRENAYL
ncbi:MAG: Fe-S biogenesis protein NfuA [Pseudomonadota bacterium]